MATDSDSVERAEIGKSESGGAGRETLKSSGDKSEGGGFVSAASLSKGR